jgi:hypothetical protein
MNNSATVSIGLPDSVRLDIATFDKPRHWRTLGLTDNKPREASKKAWLERAMGWSDIFGRFATFAKPRTP